MVQLVKTLPAMQETWVQSLGWEDPPGEGNSYPLQCSGLENSMDYTVHGATKSWTQLRDFHFHYGLLAFHSIHPLNLSTGPEGTLNKTQTNKGGTQLFKSFANKC